MRLLYYVLGLFLAASSGILYIVYVRQEPQTAHHVSEHEYDAALQAPVSSEQQHEEKKEEASSTHQTVEKNAEQIHTQHESSAHHQAHDHKKSGCGCHKELAVKKPEQSKPTQHSAAKKVDTNNQAAQSKPEEKQKKRTEKTEHAKQTTITLPINDSFRPKERHQPGTLGYKHWTGWYYPSKFILSINGVEILSFDGYEFKRMRTELTFNPNEPLKTGFVWEFLGGRKAGWRSTDFELEPGADSIDIGFDWKDQWQVMIKNAHAIPESDRSSDNRNVTKR